jgi:hypothetical protein
MKKFFFAAAVMFTATLAKAQSVDDIVNRYMDSLGGKAAWAKVNSLVMEGAINIQGTDITVNRTVLNGKGMRLDIVAMGMNGYQIMTPTEGWSYMPFQGQTSKEAVPAEDVKESQEELDVTGSLFNYKEKGNTAELIGKEDVEGTECFNIKLTTKGGKVSNYFIDTKNFFLVKRNGKIKANGTEIETSTSYANYQKLPEGIVVAMTITQQFGDMQISKVVVNGPVDEKIFKPE